MPIHTDENRRNPASFEGLDNSVAQSTGE